MVENTADLDLGSEALSSVAAKFTMSGLGFIGVVLFARVLGPAGTGRYYFALAIALLLVRVDAGVGVALKKRVSEVGSDPRPYLAVGLAFHFAWVILVTTTTFAVAYYTDFLPMTPLVVSAIIAVLATVGLFQILNRFYAGLGYPSRSLWADTIRSVLTLGFQLPLLFAGYEAFGLLAGLAGGTFITALGVFAAAGIQPGLEELRDTGEDIFIFARYSVPTAVVEDFYKRVDVILIGFFAGDAAVGFYETALRIVTPAQQLSGSISNALGVKVSGLTSLGQAIRGDVVNTVAYSGLLILPMFFGALAIPAALMRTFFGSSFGVGGPALVGVASFFIFYIYQDPFATALESSDRPQFVFWLRTAALLIHLPLAVMLGYYWDGLLGIIVATLSVEILIFISYQYVSKKQLGGVILPRPLWAQLGSAVLMYVAVITIRPLVALSWWLPVVGLVAFGAAIYFATLTALSPHFRVTIGNILLPVLRRIEERVAKF
jgi:O-antigen/teichoic acid export membrane protein